MNRTTFQKQCVMKALRDMRGQHPTTESVYREVAKIIPSISPATVYRILNQNAERGVIAKLHVPDSAARYDDLMSPHYHLLCNSCQRLFDLPPLRMREIPAPRETVSGHTITGVEFIFRGVCAECAKRKA